MSQKILIIGGGFAGLWSALGAARVLDNNGRSGDVEVTLISPEPLLHLRPRLHEQAPHGMTTPLLPVLEAAGVRYIHLARLADLPPSEERNTVVVVGGGFTGIEVAAEMPERLRKVFGHDAKL